MACNIITVATAKDKTTAKDNAGAGDELLKMVKQKRVCNINNNQSINICQKVKLQQQVHAIIQDNIANNFSTNKEQAKRVTLKTNAPL